MIDKILTIKAGTEDRDIIQAAVGITVAALGRKDSTNLHIQGPFLDEDKTALYRIQIHEHKEKDNGLY